MCNASASASMVLAGMHSPGTLEIFELDGGGLFGIDLNIINGSANYSAEGDVNEAGWNSITSSWDGHFTVDYEFREIPAQAPEPATLLLFGAGLAGLGAARKRRKISVS